MSQYGGSAAALVISNLNKEVDPKSDINSNRVQRQICFH